MKFVWDSPLCTEYSSSPSSFAFWTWFLLFWDVSCLEGSISWIRVLPNSLWRFWSIYPSGKTHRIASSHELEILSFWENPNPLWSSLEFSRSVNLFGKISRGYVHGVDAKLSSKFHRILLRLLEIWHLEFCWRAVWEWPVWPVWVTGLTGLEFEFPARPVWPVSAVQFCISTRFASALLPGFSASR